MLSDLLYEKGQDRFEDYKFSGKAWSALCLEDPAKIRELLDSFHLVGRRIKKLRLIGLNYTLVRDRIEDAVYGSLAGLPEEERQAKSAAVSTENRRALQVRQTERYAQRHNPWALSADDPRS